MQYKGMTAGPKDSLCLKAWYLCSLTCKQDFHIQHKTTLQGNEDGQEAYGSSPMKILLSSLQFVLHDHFPFHNKDICLGRQTCHAHHDDTTAAW